MLKNHIGAGTIDQQDSGVYPVNQQEAGSSMNLAANYPICFHFKRVKNGKDDSSSEAHLQSSKTSTGSYLDPEF